MGRSRHSKRLKKNQSARVKAIEPWNIRQTQIIHDELMARVEEENRLTDAMKQEDLEDNAYMKPEGTKVETKKKKPRRRVKVTLVKE